MITVRKGWEDEAHLNLLKTAAESLHEFGAMSDETLEEVHEALRNAGLKE